MKRLDNWDFSILRPAVLSSHLLFETHLEICIIYGYYFIVELIRFYFALCNRFIFKNVFFASVLVGINQLVKRLPTPAIQLMIMIIICNLSRHV